MNEELKKSVTRFNVFIESIAEHLLPRFGAPDWNEHDAANLHKALKGLHAGRVAFEAVSIDLEQLSKAAGVEVPAAASLAKRLGDFEATLRKRAAEPVPGPIDDFRNGFPTHLLGRAVIHPDDVLH